MNEGVRQSIKHRQVSVPLKSTQMDAVLQLRARNLGLNARAIWPIAEENQIGTCGHLGAKAGIGPHESTKVLFGDKSAGGEKVSLGQVVHSPQLAATASRGRRTPREVIIIDRIVALPRPIGGHAKGLDVSSMTGPSNESSVADTHDAPLDRLSEAAPWAVFPLALGHHDHSPALLHRPGYCSQAFRRRPPGDDHHTRVQAIKRLAEPAPNSASTNVCLVRGPAGINLGDWVAQLAFGEKLREVPFV